MAELESIVPLAAGVEPQFPGIEQLDVAYEKKRDILYVSVRPPRPAISVDLNGEAWIRLVRETGEVVGFEIEDFERAFLRNHPDLAREWRAGQGSDLTNLLHRQQDEEFFSHLVALLRECFAARLKQHSLPA